MYLQNDVDKNMLIFFRVPVMIKEKDERLLENCAIRWNPIIGGKLIAAEVQRLFSKLQNQISSHRRYIYEQTLHTTDLAKKEYE